MSSQDLHQQSCDLPGSQWPHRWALILACGVFPLIWMGGLVTTKEAGMSVPDWPTTYHSWFYPLEKWLWNFNDLFLEHSHRTIAQIDGIIAIILIVSIWRWEPRKSVRWLAIAILVGLISQGVLGGYRVILNDRVLARIHGCAAPLVFALCAAMVSITSATWRGKAERLENPASRSVQQLALAVCCGLYAEIVLGAQFRHPLPDASTFLSLVLVWIKVNIAAFLVAGMVYLLVLVLGQLRQAPLLVRRVKSLAVLYFLQLALAACTWVSNFGWPKWFTDNIMTMKYTVVENGRLQVWATTAHAAVGSLCFVAALSVTMWSYRLLCATTNLRSVPSSEAVPLKNT
ncbi:MAG: COX15/CtaA family protein [Thermoguttaceae bacterium]|jgi:cytochrome c oxidase assembly protein subunit 15